jgi:hypothetical protein
MLTTRHLENIRYILGLFDDLLTRWSIQFEESLRYIFYAQLFLATLVAGLSTSGASSYGGDARR